MQVEAFGTRAVFNLYILVAVGIQGRVFHISYNKVNEANTVTLKLKAAVYMMHVASIILHDWGHV